MAKTLFFYRGYFDPGLLGRLLHGLLRWIRLLLGFGPADKEAHEQEHDCDDYQQDATEECFESTMVEKRQKCIQGHLVNERPVNDEHQAHNEHQKRDVANGFPHDPHTPIQPAVCVCCYSTRPNPEIDGEMSGLMHNWPFRVHYRGEQVARLK